MNIRTTTLSGPNIYRLEKPLGKIQPGISPKTKVEAQCLIEIIAVLTRNGPNNTCMVYIYKLVLAGTAFLNHFERGLDIAYTSLTTL